MMQIAETTWLEGIAEVKSQDAPQAKILLLTLFNGHRYAIPMSQIVLDQVRAEIGSVAIFAPGDVPRQNGS
jgi:hypothetical protein